MKKNYYLLLMLIFLGVYTSNSQTNHSLCSQDSLSYSNVSEFFKNGIFFNKTDFVFGLLKKEVSQEKWEEGICGLILFAKAFDNLLSSGLSLNYKMSPSNTPVNNSTNRPWTPEFEKKNKFKIKMASLYSSFLHANDIYGLYVVKDYYGTNESVNFIKDVNNVIDFGGYTHPKVLKDILLRKKYKDLTPEGVARKYLEGEGKKN